jgi:hypothetical protein
LGQPFTYDFLMLQDLQSLSVMGLGLSNHLSHRNAAGHTELKVLTYSRNCSAPTADQFSSFLFAFVRLFSLSTFLPPGHSSSECGRGGVQEKRFKSGEQWEVLRREKGTVIVGKDGVEKQLPLDQTRSFSVFEREKICIAIGDRIRFTKNVKHRGQKFLNNELRIVVSIDEGKIIFDKGEIVRTGAALHLDQG